MRRNQMCNRRWAFEETVKVLLEHAIGLGHSLVLPQVLEPRLNEKRFQKSPWFGDILKQAPRVGAIPAAFM
jgi:hypothetical protein